MLKQQNAVALSPQHESKYGFDRVDASWQVQSGEVWGKVSYAAPSVESGAQINAPTLPFRTLTGSLQRQNSDLGHWASIFRPVEASGPE